MSLFHFTDNNFKKDVLESKLPVLVDFWATWCGPCKIVAPLVEELAKEYSNRIKIGKLNVEESPKTASQFGIMSVPALMFFKDGKVMDQVVGGLSRAELKRKIEENL
jgi:thioredoxin 1